MPEVVPAGHVIDGFWCRSDTQIDARLEAQLTGEDITPDPLFWAVWGYELLTDIHCQIHILDPEVVLRGWSQRLDLKLINKAICTLSRERQEIW